MDVVVVIPIYKEQLSDLESKSLEQAYHILSVHKLIVIKPSSLNLNKLSKKFPLLSFVSFDDVFFQGIKGYNSLMLSSLFYKEFLYSQYMLIYQLDAYVFKDELLKWCNKGYDYIGGPWLKKPVYNLPLVKEFMHFIHWHKQLRGKFSKQMLYNKIGNGGLSLRKVEAHYQATITYQHKIEYYLSQKRYHGYNEDVFWAIEVPEFNFPDPLEALAFSFDKYPSLCYKLNKHQLPFGCHAWHKRKMRRFWKPIIGI